jgi:hypothetical protein
MWDQCSLGARNPASSANSFSKQNDGIADGSGGAADKNTLAGLQLECSKASNSHHSDDWHPTGSQAARAFEKAYTVHAAASKSIIDGIVELAIRLFGHVRRNPFILHRYARLSRPPNVSSTKR